MKKFKIILIVLLSLQLNLGLITTSLAADGDQTSTQEATNNAEGTPIRKERLPTTVKPETLPGPRFRQADRTGQAATEFLTEKLIPKIAMRITSYIAIGAIFGLMYAGFLYISDLGTEENLEKAKNVATYSIVAIFVAAFAFVLVQAVNLLPLNILQ